MQCSAVKCTAQRERERERESFCFLFNFFFWFLLSVCLSILCISNGYVCMCVWGIIFLLYYVLPDIETAKCMDAFMHFY